MRGGVAAALVFGALAVTVPSAGAGSKPIGTGPSMTVTASPRVARARAVRLTLTLRYEMQCGYPGKGPLAVTFPTAVKVPKQFAAGAVTLSGNAIAARVKGRRVTVTIPPHKGVLCNLIGPGALRLTFTHAAKLANPARAGSYGFRAKHADRAFAAKLKIEPAG
jgi:hypothetical protein